MNFAATFLLAIFAVNCCTGRRIHGEDAFSVIAGFFAGCHYI